MAVTKDMAMKPKPKTTPKPTPKPSAAKTRVSPLDTKAREAQAKAFKRAQEKKVWETLQKESANNDGRNTI